MGQWERERLRDTPYTHDIRRTLEHIISDFSDLSFLKTLIIALLHNPSALKFQFITKRVSFLVVFHPSRIHLVI